MAEVLPRLIVVYRVSRLTFLLGRLLVRVPVIGMVNLVSERAVVPELIQDEANAHNIRAEVTHLLQDNHYYQSVCEDLTSIKKELGEPGASIRAAQIAVTMLSP